MEEYLFKNESVITRSENDEVILTTHRVRHKKSGTSSMITMMLDSVSSIRVRYESQPILILLGIGCLVGAGILSTQTDGTYAVLLLILAIVFILLFLSSRRHVISIASSSASIDFQTKEMKREKVLDFVNNLEQARKDLLKY
jgi:hypothetical protein